MYRYELLVEAVDEMVGQTHIVRNTLGMPEKDFDDFNDDTSKYTMITFVSLFIHLYYRLDFSSSQNKNKLGLVPLLSHCLQFKSVVKEPC